MNSLNNLEEITEFPCWVCSKIHQRVNTGNYYYFDNHLVCSNHAGAKGWYDGIVLLGKQKLKLALESK